MTRPRLRLAIRAALTIFCAPLVGLAVPSTPATAQAYTSVDQAVSAFYASRRDAPLWLPSGGDRSAARALISDLQRASLDGLPSGPSLAAQAQSLLTRGEAGDPAALAAADRILSTAWVLYVQALEKPAAEMTYADSWAAPRRDK